MRENSFPNRIDLMVLGGAMSALILAAMARAKDAFAPDLFHIAGFALPTSAGPLLGLMAVIGMVLAGPVFERRAPTRSEARYVAFLIAATVMLFAYLSHRQAETWRQSAVLSQLCFNETGLRPEHASACWEIISKRPGPICDISNRNQSCAQRLAPYLEPSTGN